MSTKSVTTESGAGKKFLSSELFSFLPNQAVQFCALSVELFGVLINNIRAAFREHRNFLFQI